MTAWQLGSQPWLIQRAVLPLLLPSTMYFSLSVNRKVWPVSPPSPYFLSAWAWVMMSPLYSTISSPALMGAVAKTPFP
jgi:hypothetical protein